MIGLGTIVNASTIIAGGTLGVLLRSGLPQRFKNTIMQAIGLSVIIIGFSGALKEMLFVAKSGLDTRYTMEMIFSLVLGGLAGELIKIEDRLEKLGEWFQTKFVKSEGNFAEGFVTASLVFCVGAMAILGSLEDGLKGNTNTLFAKSILDGISSIVFSASMGIGVAFSAVPILFYQGGITLLAGFIKPWLTPEVISQMSLTGNILILAIGLGLLNIKKFKVGNFLPAIFLPLIFFLVKKLF